MTRLQVAPLLTLHVPDFRRVRLTLAGCGGTGSHLATRLAALALALDEKGITTDMLFVDPDVVERKNIGRQLFAPADLGRPKAVVLARRLNAAYGLRVESLAERISSVEVRQGALNLVVGAVDNVQARAFICKAAVAANGALWWLDTGNEDSTGQVALGNVPAQMMRGAARIGLIDRLPLPSVLWPDLIASPLPLRDAQVSRGEGRSCADALAAGDQSIMVNQMSAAWAASMLHDFLLTRSLSYFAVAFNLRYAGVTGYAIDARTLAKVSGVKVAT